MSVMRDVYKDGEVLVEYTFDEVRALANKESL
jgi:hypothetical protein